MPSIWQDRFLERCMKKNEPTPSSTQDRFERLSRALRENLRRRKDVNRARTTDNQEKPESDQKKMIPHDPS